MIVALVPLLLWSVAPQDPPPADAHVLSELVRAAAKLETAHVAGSIAERAAENDAFSGAIVVGAGAAKPYTGEIDAWRTASGELFVLSRSRVPELAYFDDGAQSIVRTTWCDDAPDVSQAIADLTGLLDLDGLASAIAKTRVECAPAGETLSFMCEVPSRIIPRGEGMTAFGRPQVKRIDARFTVEAGVLRRMQFIVVRTDPLARIRRNALQGGGGTVTATGEELSDEEGGSSVYDFALDASALSGRAATVRDGLRETLKSDAR